MTSTPDLRAWGTLLRHARFTLLNHYSISYLLWLSRVPQALSSAVEYLLPLFFIGQPSKHHGTTRKANEREPSAQGEGPCPGKEGPMPFGLSSKSCPCIQLKDPLMPNAPSTLMYIWSQGIVSHGTILDCI